MIRSIILDFLYTVCPDDGDLETVDADDYGDYITSDNDVGNGPDPAITEDGDVPIFSDDPIEVQPSTDGGNTPYIVTIETPDNEYNYPMSVDTPTTGNIDRIEIYVDDTKIDEVSRP